MSNTTIDYVMSLTVLSTVFYDQPKLHDKDLCNYWTTYIWYSDGSVVKLLVTDNEELTAQDDGSEFDNPVRFDSLPQNVQNDLQLFRIP